MTSPTTSGSFPSNTNPRFSPTSSNFTKWPKPSSTCPLNPFNMTTGVSLITNSSTPSLRPMGTNSVSLALIPLHKMEKRKESSALLVTWRDLFSIMGLSPFPIGLKLFKQPHTSLISFPPIPSKDGPPPSCYTTLAQPLITFESLVVYATLTWVTPPLTNSCPGQPHVSS